jgi:hypothetical protein
VILATGHLNPERFQIDEGRLKADGSFCSCSSEKFMSNFPQFEGFTSANDAPILLKLRNVEPHDDPWVGPGKEPRTRRAVFWLLEGGGSTSSTFTCPVIFGCGRQFKSMKPGDFVVFNDRITHWVMSEKLWRGAAVQLRKVK